MNLAFILLSQPKLPKSDEVVRDFTLFAGKNQRMRAIEREAPTGKHVPEFEIGTVGTASVAMMPAPVPNGEAEDSVRFSISAIGSGWRLPVHKAFLTVVLQSTDSVPLVEGLSCFTSVLGAVAKASGAVGVYWGSAGATHSAEFFISTAREPGILPRITLWSGLSLARERDGRLSILSLGMKQLDLPDLLLIAPKASGADALATFYDFLGYLAERGEPIRDGDSIGRTVDERLLVRYVPSPLDPNENVWRVEVESEGGFK